MLRILESEPRRRFMAGFLGTSLALSSIGAGIKPEPVSAADGPTPRSVPCELIPDFQGSKTEIFNGNPIAHQNGITPEVMLTMMIPEMDVLNSDTGLRRKYESLPPSCFIDGIFPEATIKFVNEYLILPEPLTTNDLDWARVLTMQSSTNGIYITTASSENEKLKAVSEPGSFGITSFYSNGDLIEDYMEFKVPFDFVDSIPSDAESYELIESVINLPDVPMGYAHFDISFEEKSGVDMQEQLKYTERYFALTFLNDANGYGVLILANTRGNIHIAEATLFDIIRTLTVLGKLDEFRTIQQTTP